MSSKTYFLVIYENGKPRGVMSALKSILSEENAKVLLQEANPMITRKEDGMKYQVTDKKLFEYENTDGSKTIFIICNCQKQK